MGRPRAGGFYQRVEPCRKGGVRCMWRLRRREFLTLVAIRIPHQPPSLTTLTPNLTSPLMGLGVRGARMQRWGRWDSGWCAPAERPAHADVILSPAP